MEPRIQLGFLSSRCDRDVACGERGRVHYGFRFDAYRCVPKGPRSIIPSHRRDSKGVERLGSVIWYRSKAKIKNIFKQEHPETSPSRSYAGRLPQELVEMIIARPELDKQTLKACSRTCRSWYIATLPHLHHTLTLCRKVWDRDRGGLIPLKKLDKMRLLPFVKRLWIMDDYADPLLPSDILNPKCLAYFSAFTNIQELGIDRLDLHSFVPQAQLYFGHFMPRLRSLALIRPGGPHHLLLSFLGLFPNLDDLKLVAWKSALRGPVPVSQSAPLLRGRLTLASFCGEDFLRDLSELSGGLRFRSMDLLEAEGSRFLLDSSAETLEVLRIYPTLHWTENSWTGEGIPGGLGPRFADPPTHRILRTYAPGL